MKITGLFDKPAFKTNNGNNIVFEFDSNNIKYAKKLEKLSKSKKLKSKKIFRFQNLAKSRKELSKSKKSPNFIAKKDESIFLIFNTKKIFNYL